MLRTVPPLLDRVDPRGRLVAALAFSILLAIVNRPPALLAGLAAAACGIVFCGMRPVTVARRMMPLNAFMLLLVLIMPWTVAGQPLATWGSLQYSTGGLRLAVTIALKGNVIVLMLVALVGSLHMNTLGHALSHLRVPDKLAHLLLFTVRYLDVLRCESMRLRTAMRLRGFRPRANWHTYRAYGNLIGMLMVRSLDRAERVLAAMKCRGFTGQFYLLDHFHYSRYDFVFSILVTSVLVLVAALEWQ
jgi:cobalt/nickel transport system permease protein